MRRPLSASVPVPRRKSVWLYTALFAGVVGDAPHPPVAAGAPSAAMRTITRNIRIQSDYLRFRRRGHQPRLTGLRAETVAAAPRGTRATYQLALAEPLGRTATRARLRAARLPPIDTA